MVILVTLLLPITKKTGHLYMFLAGTPKGKEEVLNPKGSKKIENIRYALFSCESEDRAISFLKSKKNFPFTSLSDVFLVETPNRTLGISDGNIFELHERNIDLKTIGDLIKK